MKNLFKQLEELKGMLDTNINTDWSENDPAEEFNALKEILDNIIGEKEYNFHNAIKEYLRGKGYFVQNMWSDQDVIQHGADLGYEISEEQAIEIFDLLGRRFDANYGVNWDSIESVIDEYFEN